MFARPPRSRQAWRSARRPPPRRSNMRSPIRRRSSAGVPQKVSGSWVSRRPPPRLPRRQLAAATRWPTWIPTTNRSVSHRRSTPAGSRIFALVRLKSYDALARLTLDGHGQPISHWWPVAFAFQRLGDKQATEALATLASSAGVYTPSFAMRGLAAFGDARVVPIAQGLATRAAADVRVRIAAVRALGQVGGTGSVDTLLALVRDRTTPQNLALEAVTAIGHARDPRAFDSLLDVVNDPWPTMRAAALEAAAAVEPERFMFVVASLGADRDWSVRAALAGIFAKLPADRVRDALMDLVGNPDTRVQGPALTALAKVGAPESHRARLFQALESPDFVVRATGGPPESASRSPMAVWRSSSPPTPEATRMRPTSPRWRLWKASHTTAGRTRWRRSIRRWRTRSGPFAGGLPTCSTASASRTRSRSGPRPCARHLGLRVGRAPPSPYSAHMLVETHRGTIEIELDVVNAPLTSARIIAMARAGFFNGMKINRVVPDFVVQAGDPRGDGEGGPGYTMPDELSATPYVRGTVGMALDFRDTGGSQFFITLSPQPHLDDKYTVFGRVVNGVDSSIRSRSGT